MTAGTTIEKSATKSATSKPQRRAVERRRLRVWANVAGFLVVTAIMVVLSMAQRDTQSMQRCERNLEFASGRLQAMLAEGRYAPLNLPLPGMEEETTNPRVRALEENAGVVQVREHYFYNSRYRPPRDEETWVGVCCCRASHRLYLFPEGRHVLVFNGSGYEIRWLLEADFRAQAAELGFNLPD